MTPNPNFCTLLNKTIVAVKLRRHTAFDDEGYLDIVFTNGSSVCLVATYSLYTGRSFGEYPTKLLLKEAGYEDQ